MTQPEFARFVVSESERAARVLESSGIKAQWRASVGGVCMAEAESPSTQNT
jgi:hypothetical protein